MTTSMVQRAPACLAMVNVCALQQGARFSKKLVKTVKFKKKV